MTTRSLFNIVLLLRILSIAITTTTTTTTCFSFPLQPLWMRRSTTKTASSTRTSSTTTTTTTSTTAISTTRLYEGLDDLRNMLESSWNVDSMGNVPSSPLESAKEAASCILQARQDGLGRICFVDLLLPQYDIQQGSNLYDEVEAVDFCTLLSDCLQLATTTTTTNTNTKSVIYVRDSKSLNIVSKVIEARRKSSQEESMSVLEDVQVVIDEDDPEWDDYMEDDAEHDDDDNYDDDDDDDDINEKIDNDLQSSSGNDTTDKTTNSDSPIIFDDFSDFNDESGDNFFSPLVGNGGSTNEPKKKRTKSITKRIERKVSASSASSSVPSYRLASLFGNEKISSGKTMSQDVVRAVKAHGMPRADEDTLIVLSANSPEEMLAIRALVAKYQTDKNNNNDNNKYIILVNCRLNPLPLELEDCTTVYHLTPLIATTTAPTADPRNIFGMTKQNESRKNNNNNNDNNNSFVQGQVVGNDSQNTDERRTTSTTDQSSSIKVVSIRRYPGDWEVYVDADNQGFELAERAHKKFSKQGPTWEWIGGVVKSFLMSRNKA